MRGAGPALFRQRPADPRIAPSRPPAASPLTGKDAPACPLRESPASTARPRSTGCGTARCRPSGVRATAQRCAAQRLRPAESCHRNRGSSRRGVPRGFDIGKKVKGRTRDIVTDAGGLAVGAPIRPAGIQDRDGAPALPVSIRCRSPRLRRIFADGAYAGPKLKAALEGEGAAADRSGRACAAAGLPGVAAARGGEADAGMAEPQPAAGRGLRGDCRRSPGMALYRKRPNPDSEVGAPEKQQRGPKRTLKRRGRLQGGQAVAGAQVVLNRLQNGALLRTGLGQFRQSLNDASEQVVTPQTARLESGVHPNPVAGLPQLHRLVDRVDRRRRGAAAPDRIASIMRRERAIIGLPGRTCDNG